MGYNRKMVEKRWLCNNYLQHNDLQSKYFAIL